MQMKRLVTIRLLGARSIFLVLAFMVAIVSCEPKKETKPAEYDWLFNTKNIKDSTYESKYDEAYKKYAKLKEYNNQAYILIAKGNVLDYHFKDDSVYLEQCKFFIEKNKTKLSNKANLELHYYVGSQLDFFNKKKESEKWLKEAIAYAGNADRNQMVGFAYTIIASQKRNAGQLDSAQFYSYKALNTFELLKDTANMGMVQSNIFSISSSLQEPENAKKALAKMVEYSWASKDTLNACQAYVYLASYSRKLDASYQQLRLYIDTIDQIMNSWSAVPDQPQFMLSYLKGTLNLKDKKFVEAKKCIEKCKTLASKSSFDAYYLNQLEFEYNFKKNGRINKAQYDKLLEQMLKKKNYSELVPLVKNAVESDLQNQNYKQAYTNYKLQMSFRDSLWNKELKSKLFEFEKKYETVKKEKKIVEQKQEIGKRNSMIGLLAAGLLIGLLGFVLYNNQKKRKATEKEKELQEQYTEQLLQNTEEERERIAGDLHDSVNHQLLQLTNKVKKGADVKETELKELMEKIRSISHNLHPAMFEQVGLELSIKDLCQKVMEHSSLQIIAQIDYEKKLSTKQELQVYRIVQEAINNILKHSKATHAFIKILSAPSELEVSIKDNGQGFDAESLANKKPTFGLSNIKQRAKAIKGIVNLKSDQQGTQINLTINT